MGQVTADRTRKRAKDAACFVAEFPIQYSPKQRKKARARLNVGTIVYNACLREAFDRAETMHSDPRWVRARVLPKTNVQRRELFQAATKDAGFTEWSMKSFGSSLRVGNIADAVFGDEAQQLAARAYTAVADWNYRGKGKPRYRQVRRGIRSMGTNGRKSSMRLIVDQQVDTDTGEITSETYTFRWGKNMVAPIRVDMANPVHAHNIEAVKNGLLRSRIVRRNIRGRDYFYVQFTVDGTPFQRYEVGDADAVVGLDLGPSTIAVVTDSGAFLERFCDELDSNQKLVRRLQRKLDRQHRAGSPDCFDKKSRHTAGRCVWMKSGAAQHTVARIAEAGRTKAAHRTSLHGNLTNRILALGATIHTESLSKVAWQRNYGKSVSFRAPGAAETLLSRKAASAGGTTVLINPYRARLSQSCVCGRVCKKPLSLRVHECPCGVREQRDIWSAFLARHTDGAGTFLPQAAHGELSERHDIGVGRGNVYPKLRLPDAVKLPVPSQTAGKAGCDGRATRLEVRHISALIPTLPDKACVGEMSVRPDPQLSSS